MCDMSSCLPIKGCKLYFSFFLNSCFTYPSSFHFYINNFCLIILGQMLQKHVDVCREEDDSTNMLDMANYDSEDDDEDDLSLNIEGMWLCIQQDYLFVPTLR